MDWTLDIARACSLQPVCRETGASPRSDAGLETAASIFRRDFDRMRRWSRARPPPTSTLARPRASRPGQAAGLAGARSPRRRRHAGPRRAGGRGSSTTKGARDRRRALWAALAADAPDRPGSRRLPARARRGVAAAARGRHRRRAGAGAGVRRAGAAVRAWPDPWIAGRRMKDVPECRACWSSMIAIRPSRWFTASCRSWTRSRAATAHIPCQVCEERDRGCPLKCAHDWQEAAEALAALHGAARPGGARPALRAARRAPACPRTSRTLPAEPKARRAALEGLRRRQGLLDPREPAQHLSRRCRSSC